MRGKACAASPDSGRARTLHRKARAAAGCAWALCCAFAVAGCVSKSKADLQARMAYLAGERDAYLQIQAQRARGPSVTVLGQVKNHIVKWTPGLSLSQAIVRAEYTAARDPSGILIHRAGQDIQINPKQLLSGTDVPLEPSDVVELRE
jgi:hypothetical protein